MSYRQTSGTVVGNELKDLRKIITKPHQPHPQDSSVAKKHFLPTTVVETPAATISRDDPIDVAVLKFVSTHKGYTPDEIHYGLVDKVSDPKMIRPTLFALNNNGYFDSNIIVVAGKSKTIYTLKRGRSHHDLATDIRRPSVGIRKFKLPDEPIAARIVQISLDDGIDLAVYKVMSDRKWRTRNEVMEILRAFGFDPSEVKKRFVTLGYGKRNWFERQDTGHTLNYRLRKTIAEPAVGDVQDDEVVFTGNYEDLHVGEQVSEAVAVEAVAVEAVEAAITEAKVEAAPQASHPALGDSMTVAIWKVMSDYKQYTSSDVQLLLSEYPYNQKTIGIMMSKLFAKDWFDRESREGTRGFVYTLRRDVPMPENTAADAKPDLTPIEQAAIALAQQDNAVVADVTAALAAQATEQTTTNAVLNKEEEVMTKSATAPLLQVVSQTPAPSAALLECTITLKGIQIAVFEFAQLYKELRGSGFQAGRVQKASLIQANSYNIKGVEFTAAELDELVGKMSELGLAFSKAVTL